MFEQSRRAGRRWAVALLVAAVTASVGGAPVAGQSSPAPSGASTAPSCGTDPVELLAYFETGFTLLGDLANEFSRQFPNVTWNIRQDQFTNLMQETSRLLHERQPARPHPAAVDDRPCQGRAAQEPRPVRHRFRLGQVAAGGVRAEPRRRERPRGIGSLYAAGLNSSMTGVFYNKKLAEQIGMTEPPKTLDEFEALLAKAKAAGLLPIMQWGSATSGMGLAFPLQNLMASVGPTGPINDWIFQKPGATIDTPSNLIAAQHLEQWIKNGYFPDRRQRHRLHALERALQQGRGCLHVQRRLGERRLRQEYARQRRVLPDAARDRWRQRTARCPRRSPMASPPTPSTPTARPSSSIGSSPTRRHDRSMSPSAARTRAAPPMLAMPTVAGRLGHQ